MNQKGLTQVLLILIIAFTLLFFAYAAFKRTPNLGSNNFVEEIIPKKVSLPRVGQSLGGGRLDIGQVRYSIPDSPRSDSGLIPNAYAKEIITSQAILHVVDTGFYQSRINLYDTQSQVDYRFVDTGGLNYYPKIIDGQKVLYLTRPTSANGEDQYSVRIIDLVTLQSEEIPNLKVNPPGSISPNGTKFAFADENQIAVLDVNTQEVRSHYVNLKYHYDSPYGSGRIGGEAPIPVWKDDSTVLFSDKNVGTYVGEFVSNNFYQLDINSGKSTQVTNTDAPKIRATVYGNRLYYIKYTDTSEGHFRHYLSFLDIDSPLTEKEIVDTENIDYGYVATADLQNIITHKHNYLENTVTLLVHSLNSDIRTDIYPFVKASGKLKRDDFSVMTLLGWSDPKTLLFMTSGPYMVDPDFIYSFNLETRETQYLVHIDKMKDSLLQDSIFNTATSSSILR